MNLPLSRIPIGPRAVALTLACPALLFLGGCVEGPVRVRREVYVQPAPPPVAEVVYVGAPPPPREEVIIAQPSPAHVWIKGYYVWRESRHVWIAGHWELPPRHGYVWVEPRWERRDRGYVFLAGGWHEGPAVHVSLSFVAQPPPPPRHEVIIERNRPSPEHIWIKGYYVWREGRHVWVAGHWERPPHRGAVWIEPRWEHRPEGFFFIEGVWR